MPLLDVFVFSTSHSFALSIRWYACVWPRSECDAELYLRFMISRDTPVYSEEFSLDVTPEFTQRVNELMQTWSRLMPPLLDHDLGALVSVYSANQFWFFKPSIEPAQDRMLPILPCWLGTGTRTD